MSRFPALIIPCVALMLSGLICHQDLCAQSSDCAAEEVCVVDEDDSYMRKNCFATCEYDEECEDGDECRVSESDSEGAKVCFRVSTDDDGGQTE